MATRTKSEPATRVRRRRRRRGARLTTGWLIGGIVAAALVAFVVVQATTRTGPQVSGGEVAGGARARPAEQARGSPAGAAVAAKPSLPDFPLILYQGQELVGRSSPRFSDLLGRQPVVLNYWASNCPPCSAEMPEFQKVSEHYQGRVLFVGLDVGRFLPGFGKQAQSKRELKRLGITYIAGTPVRAETVRDLRVRGLPSTVFLTPSGAVHKEWVGILNAAKLTELVEELLQVS